MTLFVVGGNYEPHLKWVVRYVYLKKWKSDVTEGNDVQCSLMQIMMVSQRMRMKLMSKAFVYQMEWNISAWNFHTLTQNKI